MIRKNFRQRSQSEKSRKSSPHARCRPIPHSSHDAQSRPSLLGFTSSPQPATAGQPSQDQGGFFSKLFGLGGGQPQPAGAPLNLQPASAPQMPTPLNGDAGSVARSAAASDALSYAPQPASRSTFPSTNNTVSARSVNAVPGGDASSPTFAPAPSGSLPTFAAGAGLPTGQDNTSKALAFYQAKGLSPLAASALVGGFKTESGPGLNTQAVNVGDGQDGSNSIGVPQWNGDRAPRQDHARRRNRPGRSSSPTSVVSMTSAKACGPLKPMSTIRPLAMRRLRST